MTMRGTKRLYPALLILYLLVISSCRHPENPNQIPDPRESAHLLLARASSLVNESQYTHANFYLSKALILFKKMRNWQEMIRIYIIMADNHQNMGRYKQALQVLRQALAIVYTHSVHGPLELANSLHKLAYSYFIEKKFDQALYLYKQSLTLRRQRLGEDHPDVAKSLNSIARLYMAKGETGKAEDYYARSLDIKLKPLRQERIKKIVSEFRHREPDGIRRDYSRERVYVKKTLAQHQESYGENHPALAEIFQQLGVIHALEGSFRQALFYLQKATTMLLSLYGENHIKVAGAYHYLALVMWMKKDIPQALRFLHQALPIKEQFVGFNHPDTAESYYQLGRMHAMQHEYQRALQLFQQALKALINRFQPHDLHQNPPFQSIVLRKPVFKILAAKGEALYHYFIRHPRRQKYLKSALATYVMLTRLMKSMQLSYRSQEYKLYFASKCYDIYDKAIEVATLLYTLTRKSSYKKTAFTFSELSKAWILSEAITEARARKFSGLPAALLDREKKVRSQLIHYELAVEKGYQQRGQSSQKHINSMREIYYQFLDQYQKLIASLEKDYPKYHQLKFNILPYRLEDVQNRLDHETALVEYFVGQNQIHTFVITRRSCRLAILDRPAGWPSEIERFYQAIKKIEEDIYLKLSGRLHQQLIAPIIKHLQGVKRLVIIPHDMLFYIPFEALIPRHTKKTPFSKLPYLVKDYAISYHYSANLWLGSRDTDQIRSGKTFVGFAPIFRPRQKLAGRIDGKKQRDIVVNNRRYPTLPASEKEISTVQQMFQHQGHRAEIFINQQASESRFKSNLLKQFSYIHIASHGLMNQIQPKLSGILFHPPPEGSQEDGILFSGETFNLNLKARLIVLSSCESGIGQLVKGEGMVALNRGFLYSGAANIIFSLWKIEDQPTSRLMISLYRHILDNQSLAHALQQAKKSLIGKPTFAFPKYWAGFILLGQ